MSKTFLKDIINPDSYKIFEQIKKDSEEKKKQLHDQWKHSYLHAVENSEDILRRLNEKIKKAKEKFEDNEASSRETENLLTEIVFLQKLYLDAIKAKAIKKIDRIAG